MKTNMIISLFQKNWRKDVLLKLGKDSRYFNAVSNNPDFLYEIILDEVDNFFSSLFILKGLHKKTIYKNFNRVPGSFNNIVVLIENFLIPPFEGLRFMVPGEIEDPQHNSSFDFVMSLLMKPYLFGNKIFNTPRFSFQFYNDKKDGAYEEWNEEIDKILSSW
jgi:hypothetical protein